MEAEMKMAYCIMLGFMFLEGANGYECLAQKSSETLQTSLTGLSNKTDIAFLAHHELEKAPTVLSPVVSQTGTVASALERPRIADRKYFWLNGMQLGMAVFDVEMTQRCIADRRCREANPVMPSSHIGQLSVNFALVAYTSGVSYWLKKRRSKIWWLPSSASIAVHSVGVATGFEHQ
jgi:hypothetical protein